MPAAGGARYAAPLHSSYHEVLHVVDHITLLLRHGDTTRSMRKSLCRQPAGPLFFWCPLKPNLLMGGRGGGATHHSLMSYQERLVAYIGALALRPDLPAGPEARADPAQFFALSRGPTLERVSETPGHRELAQHVGRAAGEVAAAAAASLGTAAARRMAAYWAGGRGAGAAAAGGAAPPALGASGGLRTAVGAMLWDAVRQQVLGEPGHDALPEGDGGADRPRTRQRRTRSHAGADGDEL